VEGASLTVLTGDDFTIVATARMVLPPMPTTIA